MKKQLLMDFTVDKTNNEVKVKREFDAPAEQVWAAWTEKDLLDQWWAPAPWKSKTKSMDFQPGGIRLYAMVGPAGEEHWAIQEFSDIHPIKNFSFRDAFCDNQGNITSNMPRSDWKVHFAPKGDATVVDITIKHQTLADLEKIIAMGFKEGFTIAMEGLDEVFEKQGA